MPHHAVESIHVKRGKYCPGPEQTVTKHMELEDTTQSLCEQDIKLHKYRSFFVVVTSIFFESVGGRGEESQQALRGRNRGTCLEKIWINQ